MQPHVAEIRGAGFALVDTRERLNLVANLRVTRKIAGLDGAAAEAFGGLALGGEVLGFHPLVHEPGGFKRNGLTQLGVGHVGYAAVIPLEE